MRLLVHPNKKFIQPTGSGTWDIGEAHIQHRYIVPDLGQKNPVGFR